MPFTDALTGTDGQDLSARTGWSKPTDGLYYADIYSNALAFRSDSGTGESVYTCTDQGSANQYTQAQLKNFTQNWRESAVCINLVDKDNYVGWRLYGFGVTGLRLTKNVAGTKTDLISIQGAQNDTYKVERDGSTVRLYKNAVQQGSDQTVTDHQTETTQGIVVGNAVGNYGLIANFEAGAVGGGGTTVILGLASETETALSVTSVNPRTYSVGVVSESETALSITSINPRSYSVGLVTDTESALTITPSIAAGGTTVALGIATDSESVLSITPSKTVSLGLPIETSEALSIAPSKIVGLGLVEETETALSVTVLNPRSYTVGIVTETETALPIIRIGGAETEYSETFLETVIRAKEVQLSGTIISSDSVELTTSLFYEENQTTKISDRQVQVRADLTGDTRQTTVIG